MKETECKTQRLVLSLALLFILGLPAFVLGCGGSGTLFNSSSTIDPDRQAYADRIIADLLSDLTFIDSHRRAVHYVELGEILWRQDPKKARAWFEQGIESILDPSTSFPSSLSRFELLVRCRQTAAEKSKEISSRLESRIKAILEGELRNDGSKELNSTLISLANFLYKSDPEYARKLAQRSIQGNSPYIGSRTLEYFVRAHESAPESAASFYEAVLATIRKREDKETLRRLIAEIEWPPKGADNYPFHQIPEPQRRATIGLMVDLVGVEAKQLATGKIRDCGFSEWPGNRRIEDVRTLVPHGVEIVQSAIKACNDANIEFWKKPNRGGRSLRTVDDFLAFAKDVTDRKSRVNYLYSAALRARTDKAFQRAIDILDSIEPEDRDLFGWRLSRVYSASGLVLQSLERGEVSEIDAILEKAPENLRPFILLQTFARPTTGVRIYKDLKLKYIDRARQELLALDPGVPSSSTPTQFSSPLKILELSREYWYLGLQEQAFSIWSDYIDLLNKNAANIGRDSRGRRILYFDYLTPSFSHSVSHRTKAYEQTARLVHPAVRAKIRLNFLWETLSNGSRGGGPFLVLD